MLGSRSWSFADPPLASSFASFTTVLVAMVLPVPKLQSLQAVVKLPPRSMSTVVDMEP
jgi:hypothetical protein